MSATHGTAGHDHEHHRTYGRAFGIGIALNVAYVVIEAGYGIYANSSALTADAGHNLSDVLGLVLAWAGLLLTHSAVTKARTYGLRKASIMASFLNSVLLLGASGVIGIEALSRLFSPPEPVGGVTMMVVAGAGVIVNSTTALYFMKGRKADINIRGAFLHMASDAGVSLGVVVAGLAVWWTGAYWIDPVISLLIVGSVVVSSVGLLKESFRLSMDAVPTHVTYDAVRDYLASVPGVGDVHDLHIWAMSSTETALTAHLVVFGTDAGGPSVNLDEVSRILRNTFGIHHTTLQIEQTTGCTTGRGASV